MTQKRYLNIRARLLGAFGLILLLAVAQSAYAYVSTLANREATAWVDHTQSVLAVANATLARADGMESDYRDYLLTGDLTSFVDYSTQAQAVSLQLGELVQLTGDNPPQVARWRSIADQMHALQVEITDPAVAVREGVTAGTTSPDVLTRLIQARPEQRPFAAVRRGFGDAIGVEQQLLRERLQRANEANAALGNVLLWGTLAIAWLGVVIAFLLATRIGTAMGRVASVSGAIASGDFAQRIRLRRGDEIGRAAAAFDQMADALQRDHEARSRAQAALEASEARYKDLVAQASDIIYRTDADGHFVYVNPSATRILGFTEEELLGRHYLDLVHADDRDQLRRVYALQRARRRPNTYSEFRARHKNGSNVWIGQNVQLLGESDQFQGFQAIARDITDRRRAEDALIALQHQTESILNSAAEGIFGLDRRGRISMANPMTETLTGYTLEELRGRTVHGLLHHSRTDGSHYPASECPVSAVLRDGVPRTVRDEMYWRKDGSSFPVEYSAVPLREHGHVTGAVVNFRDITERLAVERMKDEFVSIVSHELRTPLTSIRGSLGLLAAGLLGPLSDKGKRMVDVAVSNTDRLIRLINDILDIERIESGRISMDRRPTDARELVSRSIETTRGLADAAQLRLENRADDVSVFADPDRIQQTLTNLIGNAIKFSPPGTVIAVTAQRRDDEALFSVADQGRGIPPEKLDTIFGRFEQVDASDSREKGGTGLGLAICKSIVQQHGGRIWVESELGRGSTFLFTIPRASVAEPPPTVPGDTRPVVLVCDDDPDILEVVGAMLAEGGYRAIQAETGEIAIARATAEQPGAILLDLALPGMGGWEVLAELKRQPQTRDIPVVVLSALDRVRDERSDSLDGWLDKPLTPQMLYETLGAVLAPRQGEPRRILIVEDDADLARVLCQSFSEPGTEVRHAASAEEAIAMSEESNPDVVVLDVGLRRGLGDGYDVIDWFRQQDRLQRVPLVVYSGRELSGEERGRLLLGPTEFLTKARTSPEEVKQCVLSLLQRIVPAEEQAA